ncbi:MULTISPECIES: BrnT family toxin [unclassified Thioalkalivibrio]|uniref:BrnT family toxin n=1 Tax=unclassified Thioalkalivibrio TaxID=2621013 RepID=UPI00037A4CC6|nr:MULTISPECIES: BrnT family toxin [unclassified Thioalkalivibrio]
MEIEFDADKDAANQAKHGVSLALAVSLEWETLLAMEDRRKDYGECRMLGYALMGDRLYCVIFTDRENVRRIISLRKANNREISRYVQIVDAT